MPPFIHKLTFPKDLAEHFSQGSKGKYNEYAVKYCKANNPNMIIVTIKGQKQDAYEQGYLMAAYSPGSSPEDIAERRKENKPKKGRK